MPPQKVIMMLEIILHHRIGHMPSTADAIAHFPKALPPVLLPAYADTAPGAAATTAPE